MSSTSDKINGKTKQAVGNITNDKELETKGKVQETKGIAKGNLARAEDSIKRTDDK